MCKRQVNIGVMRFEVSLMYVFGISYRKFLTLGAEDDGGGRKVVRRVAARTQKEALVC